MKKYGFYVEKFSEELSIETLMTGDGKTQFTDVVYPDGVAAIGMSYGRGDGVGNQEQHHKKLAEDLGIKWQVKFESTASVDAMISALNEVKSHLRQSSFHTDTLTPFLVGECDIVAAYSHSEARMILASCMQSKDAYQYCVSSVPLDQIITDEEGNPTSNIGEMMNDVSEPSYLFGWD